jgi:hypothetical protein
MSPHLGLVSEVKSVRSWNRERLMSFVAIGLWALALYAAAGLAVGVAFVSAGVTRVQPMPVSMPARVLIFPGAAALWPWVLRRWLAAGRAP